MNSYTILLALCVIFSVLSYVSANEKLVVCYYGTWATYRSGQGKFDVSNINTDLCTHVIYTFVGINSEGTVISLDPYLDLPDNWGRDNFGAFNKLKLQNPKLKTLLAVGGWNEGSAKYSVMAASPTLRKNFITSASEMVRKHGFDGLDVDWEYPNRRDTVHGNADIDNFTQLLKELKEEFDKYGLILSAAVSAVGSTASLSYDVPSIVQYLDIVNVMTYDMYGAWDSVTGHNAPLHRGEGDENIGKENLNTIDVSLNYWLQQGCPPEKLVLGLPMYGRTFLLTNANVNGVRASSSGAGIAGLYTATNGFIGYNEFCQKLSTESWDLRYDSLAKVPYAVQGRNWVSYDDPDSLTAKIEYALTYNIAGVMIWSIETDDFHGTCHSEDFPLLRAINRALGKSSGTTSTTSPTTSSSTTSSPTTSSLTTSSPTTSSPTTSSPTTSSPTTSSPTIPSTTTRRTTDASSSTTSSTPRTTITTTTTTSTTTTTTPAPTDSPFVCTTSGHVSNPADCTSFYVCVIGAFRELIPKFFRCPSGLYWDQKLLTCNYPYNVICNL